LKFTLNDKPVELCLGVDVFFSIADLVAKAQMAEPKQSIISKRVLKYILPYAATFGSEAYADTYNSVTNPNGYLTTVSVAENFLMTNELLEKFKQCRDITETTMRYTFPKGSPKFTEAIADFMSWSFKSKKY